MDEESGREVSVSRVLGFVWRYWRRLPLMFAAIVTGVVVSIGLEVLIPSASADLVLAIQQLMSGAADSEAAWGAAWVLLGVFLARGVVQHLYLRLWMHFASGVMHHIVTEAFAHVQRFSTDWHTNHFAGSTQRKITRGMWAYDQLADTLAIDLGPAFVLLLGFSVAMYIREPLLGMYFAGAVAVFLTVTITLSLRYVAPANRASNAADTDLGGALADAITCNSVVKGFGAETAEEQRLTGFSNRWRLRARRAWLRSMDAGGVQTVLILLMLGGLLAIVLVLAENAAAEVDDMVYVITTYFIVNGYLRNIGWQIRNMQRSINELDDLVVIDETRPQVADAPEAAALAADAGAIEFRDVTFRYRNQPRPVYAGLNVSIAPGEKVALIGESGAGKTTFVKLLQRLYDVDSGVISIDGQDIAGVSQQSLRAQISLVPQDPILFHRSLLENIAYARPGASPEEVVAAARQAHAHDFISQLDEGYDTLVGERGIKLSGGERQRVAIARAILADKPILILDEATSSLDSATELEIQHAIAALIEQRTSIIIAHRLSTVRAVDRILVFDRGVIIEEGNHAELMQLPNGVYRHLFDIQSNGFLETLRA